MKKVFSHILLIGSLLLSSLAVMPAPALDSALQPRQVILIIGDGMDEQQSTIARNYLKGAAGKLLLDQLPLRAVVQGLTTEDRKDGLPVYVADSANTATAQPS